MGGEGFSEDGDGFADGAFDFGLVDFPSGDDDDAAGGIFTDELEGEAIAGGFAEGEVGEEDVDLAVFAPEFGGFDGGGGEEDGAVEMILQHLANYGQDRGLIIDDQNSSRGHGVRELCRRGGIKH